MKFRELKQVRQALAEARAMLAETDPMMRAMAEEEIAALAPREPALEEEIKVLLLPKDPNDEKNVILEIRAGTGGDEASLFAAEIFRMYSALPSSTAGRSSCSRSPNPAWAATRK